METFDLTLPAKLKSDLFAHLFPGDHDEHGAVLACGSVETTRGLRLLGRELLIAEEGVDYVPGKRGYRMLTPQFVRRCARYCRDRGLAYLAIHNHGGTTRVGFSPDDMASHERGYPALVDVVGGPPVGALVFAERAVAGDLWMADGTRRVLREGRVVGAAVERLFPEPLPVPRGVDATYDRQARLFGDRGQVLLRGAKVGVIGGGGVGSLLVLYLAQLGVGNIVLVEPERVEVTNLSRIPGATRFDARTWLTGAGRPRWMHRLGERFAARKVDIARRDVRRANRDVKLVGICGDIVDDAVAMKLRDCDYLFLAADSARARLVFNALAHQYLIPGSQIGSKIPVDKSTGEVGDVHVVVRPVIPDSGCLRCGGLIDAARLAEEMMPADQRERNRYVEEVPAPSVITLNAIGAGHAANEFLFSLTELRQQSWNEAHFYWSPRARKPSMRRPARDNGCDVCGLGPKSRRARGDGMQLPTRRRG